MIRVLVLLCAVMIAAAAPIPPGLRALDGQGRATPPQALFDALAAADVVLLGEEHNDAGAHRFELAVLEALALRGRKAAVAMEMFERDQQPRLAAYAAGQLTERDFLATARPWSNYHADYRPLVEFARAQGWSVTGSNVPRTIATQVSRRGWSALEGLPAAERAFAAADLECPQDAYYAKFAQAMGGGGDHAGPNVSLGNLFNAQCLKDETMAESVAGLLAPGVTIVHVNGAFHSEGRMGLAPRIERRAPGAKVVVVTIVPEGEDLAARVGDGDYVVTERP